MVTDDAAEDVRTLQWGARPTGGPLSLNGLAPCREAKCCIVDSQIATPTAGNVDLAQLLHNVRQTHGHAIMQRCESHLEEGRPLDLDCSKMQVL